MELSSPDAKFSDELERRLAKRYFEEHMIPDTPLTDRRVLALVIVALLLLGVILVIAKNG